MLEALNIELLRKYLQNQCTPEEVEEVVKWSKNHDNRKLIEQLVEKDWVNHAQDHLNSEAYDDIWNNIRRKIDSNKKRRIKYIDYLYYSKLAASVTIFLTVSLYFILNKVSSPKQENPPVEISMITKVSEWGQKLTVTLPDHSIVYLNSGSSITYPPSFNENQREVQLTGEAFFEVKTDTSSVFKVKSGPVITSVLGTSFNINTRDQNVIVSLIEGVVQLQDSQNRKNIILDPGHSVTYSDHKFIKSKVNESSLAWRHGVIHFEQMPLSVILKRLEEWYGVKITTGSMIDLKQTISGSFPNQNLENVLNGLCFSTDCKFKLKGKTVNIYE